MKTYEKTLNNGVKLTITIEDDELYSYKVKAEKGGKVVFDAKKSIFMEHAVRVTRDGKKHVDIGTKDGCVSVQFADPSAYSFFADCEKDMIATRKVTKSDLNWAKDVLEKSKEQKKTLTNAEVGARYKAYNDIVNEGGDGYIPDLKLGVTVEDIAKAEEIIRKSEANGIV